MKNIKKYDELLAKDLLYKIGLEIYKKTKEKEMVFNFFKFDSEVYNDEDYVHPYMLIGVLTDDAEWTVVWDAEKGEFCDCYIVNVF